MHSSDTISDFEFHNVLTNFMHNPRNIVTLIYNHVVPLCAFPVFGVTSRHYDSDDKLIRIRAWDGGVDDFCFGARVNEQLVYCA